MAKVRSIHGEFLVTISTDFALVEFVLGIIKIAACTGFILFAIIDDCGGVPTDSRGYIGAR
jgi:amino acid permease